MKFARGPVVLVFMGLLAVSLAAQDMPPGGGFDAFLQSRIRSGPRGVRKSHRSRIRSRLDPHNHVAQTLLFREMYRNGALETELVSGNNPFLRRKKLNPSPADGKAILTMKSRKPCDLANARLASNRQRHERAVCAAA